MLHDCIVNPVKKLDVCVVVSSGGQKNRDREDFEHLRVEPYAYNWSSCYSYISLLYLSFSSNCYYIYIIKFGCWLDRRFTSWFRCSYLLTEYIYTHSFRGLAFSGLCLCVFQDLP